MCSYLNPICDVQKVLGAAGGAVAGSVFNQVAQAFGDAAAKVTGRMWSVIAQTTTVDLSGGWFHSMLGITATLAGILITAIFALELIKSVLRREPVALARAGLGLAGGVLGAAAAIGIVTVLLAMTDRLSDGVVRTAGLGSLAALGTKIAPAGAIATTASPALILILGFLYIVASFLVWVLFVARKAMIIVAAVFAPIAFSGAASRATAGWVRKWIEFTLAMIFAKLIVVIMFTLGLSLVGSPGHGMAAVGSLFSGLAMMVLACFAPWMLFKLVHFVGGDVIGAHHHGLQQSVVTAGTTPITMARKGVTTVAGVVGAPGRAAAAGAPQPAAKLTTTGSPPPSTPPAPGSAPGRQSSRAFAIPDANTDQSQGPAVRNAAAGTGGPNGSPHIPPQPAPRVDKEQRKAVGR